MPQLVWLITGCSSGLGYTLAKAVLARGDKVIATARAPLNRLDSLQEAGATVLELDVRSSPEVLSQLVERAISICGGIDVLVPNAGYAEISYLEGISAEIWENQLGVNLFGVANVVSAVLPHFRSKRSGTTAFINSITAYAANAGGGPYTVSKHAVAGYAKTLSKEVEPFGIRSILFDLGFIKTAFPLHMQVTNPSVEDYMPIFKAAGQAAGTIPGNQPGDPERCAARIIDVVRLEGLAAGKETPTFVPLGSDAYMTIKKYAESLLKSCEEWQDLSRSVDFPGPRKGYFADIEHYWS